MLRCACWAKKKQTSKKKQKITLLPKHCATLRIKAGDTWIELALRLWQFKYVLAYMYSWIRLYMWLTQIQNVQGRGRFLNNRAALFIDIKKNCIWIIVEIIATALKNTILSRSNPGVTTFLITKNQDTRPDNEILKWFKFYSTMPYSFSIFEVCLLWT